MKITTTTRDGYGARFRIMPDQTRTILLNFYDRRVVKYTSSDTSQKIKD